MRKTFITLSLFTVIIVSAFAQQKKQEKKKYSMKISGWVRYDMIYDTRQTVAAKELQVPLYPMGKSYDKDGNDVNDHPQFASSATQTRLKGLFTGPKAFGAKTSAYIEADFASYGKEADLRLRRAFGKLQWEHSSILFGQEWHPNFRFSCFPAVLSWGAAAPYHFFSRDPQIRYTYSNNGFSSSATFVTRSGDNNKSSGMNNGTVFESPEINFQSEYNNGMFFTGAGFGVRHTTPDISSKEQAKKSLLSRSANAFIKIKNDIFTFKTEATYFENAKDGVMIGGYAIKSKDSNGIEDYTNFKTATIWSELIANVKNIEYGLFAGYTSNLGTTDKAVEIAGFRGTGIKDIFRIAPRIVVKSGKFSVGAEISHDIAKYQDTSKPNYINEYFEIKETYTVKNTRILLSAKYTF